MNFDGIILVDKEVGWSSFDVVAKIRGVLSKEYLELTGQKKKIKVGHTGTLDPLASGLMIVVVGSYCKQAEKFSKLDKIYEVQMKLGESTTTGDAEGQKTIVSDMVVSRTDLQKALDSFVGQSLQTPPIFSAVKVNGKRAYDLARAGKEVKLEPRPVEIFSITLDDYDYPYVNFTVHVSSGTYIRSLVVDVGQVLGTGAYMSALRRTKVGNHVIKDAVVVGQISSNNICEIA